MFRAVAVEQHDLLEAVVGQRLRDVEHMMHEVLEIVVDGAGEIHDVAGVAVGHDRQHQKLVGIASRRRGRCRPDDEVDVERQVRAVPARRAPQGRMHTLPRSTASLISGQVSFS